jgi:hypothetical protein
MGNVVVRLETFPRWFGGSDDGTAVRGEPRRLARGSLTADQMTQVNSILSAQ